jgi:hypothetical protein
MSSWKCFLRWALVSVAPLASCAGTAGGKVCTLIGCVDGATLYPDQAMSLEGLQKSHITVCRGQECFDGNFATLGMRPPTGSYADVVLSTPSAPYFVNISFDEVEPGMLRLTIRWEFTTVGPGIPPAKDGDVYRVTLVDETGTSTTILEEPATYSASYPNGPDCGPVCHQAVIDKRH